MRLPARTRAAIRTSSAESDLHGGQTVDAADVATTDHNHDNPGDDGGEPQMPLNHRSSDQDDDGGNEDSDRHHGGTTVGGGAEPPC